MRATWSRSRESGLMRFRCPVPSVTAQPHNPAIFWAKLSQSLSFPKQTLDFFAHSLAQNNSVAGGLLFYLHVNRLRTGNCTALKLLPLPLQSSDHFKTKCGVVHTDMGRIWLAAPGLTEVCEGSARGVKSSCHDLPSVRGSYEL